MAELKWAKEYQKIYDRSQTPSGWNSLDKVRIEEIDGLMGEVDALKVRLEVAEDKLRLIEDCACECHGVKDSEKGQYDDEPQTPDAAAWEASGYPWY